MILNNNKIKFVVLKKSKIVVKLTPEMIITLSDNSNF
jgi:hypothetical protein